MLVKLQLKKTSTANWLFLSFFLILVIGAGISEFFQAPNHTNKQLNRYRSLLQESELEGITQIDLKNRLGEFSLKKNNHGDWHITAPRHLPADRKVIHQIFKALETIKIRRIYPKDQINISNFSLDSPLMTLSYKKPNEKPITVKLGLVNPIDNSTYVMISNRDAIYHIDALKNSMEILGLSDFVDSKVFSLEKKEITGLQIYRREVDEDTLRLKFEREGDKWFGDSEEPLQKGKVDEFINRLTQINSQFILDQMSKSLRRSLAWYRKNPAYVVLVDRKKRERVRYKVSPIIGRSLPDLKVQKGKIFMVESSTLKHPYIVSTDSYRILRTRQKRFERLPFEKLFY